MVTVLRCVGLQTGAAVCSIAVDSLQTGAAVCSIAMDSLQTGAALLQTAYRLEQLCATMQRRRTVLPVTAEYGH